jgi:predicted ATP-dependent endonuclease of OLD family
MIDHLHIQRFKCFRDLRIESLGRINLITGKNNTGKTSLLEAILMRDFAWGLGRLHALRTIHFPLENDQSSQNAWWLDTYMSLFHQRDVSQPFCINDRCFHIEGVSDMDDQQLARMGSRAVLEKAKLLGEPTIPAGELWMADYIAAHSIDHDHLMERWSRVALTPKEDLILEFLKEIEPKIKRLSLLERLGTKQLYVLLDGDDHPMPISRFGDGVSRFLVLITTLVNAENGMLIVDEVDHGLHFSVQPHLWDYLFRYAKQFNVQVFATTHSADCVQAFAEIGSKAGNEEEGRLIRLYRKQGEIGEVDFDTETVQSAVASEVEMR